MVGKRYQGKVQELEEAFLGATTRNLHLLEQIETIKKRLNEPEMKIGGQPAFETMVEALEYQSIREEREDLREQLFAIAWELLDLGMPTGVWIRWGEKKAIKLVAPTANSRAGDPRPTLIMNGWEPQIAKKAKEEAL